MTTPIPILLYHHVNHVGTSSTIRPDEFRRHLAWLANHGWRSLTLTEFEASVLGEYEPGPRRFMLTFDDGSTDLSHCVNEMQQFGFTGVAFVITDRLDQELPGFLQAKEIIRLAATGVLEIQSHTHRHVHVKNFPEDLNALIADLIASRNYLTESLGMSNEMVRHLAWPWGECTPAMETAACDLGFTWQYLVQRGALTRNGQQLRLPRLSADQTTTAQLAIWMNIFASTNRARLANRLFGTIRAYRHGLAYQ